MKKADKDTLRAINRQSIINTFYRKDLVSKSEVISYTGLCPASVNNIIQDLTAEGVLEETQLGLSSGGRRPMLFKLAENIFNIAVYAINQDSIVASICNHRGELLLSKTMMSEIRGENRLRAALDTITDELRKEEALFSSVKVIALSMPGIIDYSRNIVTLSSPLDIQECNLQKMIESVWGRVVKLKIFKDSDALLLGEYYLGPSHNSSMAYLLIANGVGFSMILDDRLFFSDNCGMELGHMIVNTSGAEDGSLQLGSVGKLLCKKKAIERYAELSENKVLEVGHLGYATLVALAEEGDAEASAVIKEQSDLLGITLTNIANLFNPNEIVIGGDLANAEEVIRGAEAFLREHALAPFAKNTHVRGSVQNLTAGISAMAINTASNLFFRTKK